jgi:hypothetical protein
MRKKNSLEPFHSVIDIEIQYLPQNAASENFCLTCQCFGDCGIAVHGNWGIVLLVGDAADWRCRNLSTKNQIYRKKMFKLTLHTTFTNGLAAELCPLPKLLTCCLLAARDVFVTGV